MTISLGLLVFIILIALAFDYINGFHDAANSIATVVSTRVLTPMQAVAWAAVFNFVAAFGFGAWSDRWTRSGRSEAAIRRGMMFGGQLAAAAAVFALPYAHTAAELTVLLCIAGAATGALSLNTYAIAQMFSGTRAVGTWVGVQNAAGNISGIVGPIVTGFIVADAGFTAACWATAAVAWAGALWWIWGVPPIREIALD